MYAIRSYYVLLSELSRYEDAERTFSKVLKLNPGHREAWFRKGFALVQLLRLNEAIDRITSYNVCYTKLLRNKQRFLQMSRDICSSNAKMEVKYLIDIDPSGILVRYNVQMEKEMTPEEAAEELYPKDSLINPVAKAIFEGEEDVITSYSIHYTKLYELC